MKHFRERVHHHCYRICLMAGLYFLAQLDLQGAKNTAQYYNLTSWSPIYHSANQYNGMMCLEGVQLSLDASGKVKVTANMLLAPPVGAPALYVVNIIGKNTDTVTCAYSNQKIKIEVKEIATGNSCWSFVLVEDKLAPTVICRDTTVLCTGTLSDIDSIPGIVMIQDNCNKYSSLKISHIDKIKMMDCANDTFVMVTRTWNATDLWGRIGSCTQKISLLRPSRADIVFPSDTTVYCPRTSLSPALLGQPTIGGRPLDKFCGWIVSYEDQTYVKCGLTKKILRNWSIFDCCALSDTIVTQFIHISDTTRPIVSCKLIDSVSTSPDLCEKHFKIPTVLSASDACHGSALTTLVTIDSFTLSVPGAYVLLPIGFHSLRYDVYDPCGNVATCTSIITVKDKQKPALLCMDSIQISLPTDLIHIKPENFSAIEAFDNCGLLSIKFRRTNDFCPDGIDDTKFSDSIAVCCDDINKSFDIVFLATDIYGNTDSCSVRASVVDKSAPVLHCEQSDTIVCIDGVDFNWLDPSTDLTDNCLDSVKIKIDTIINTINLCGLGTLKRRIIAIDPANNRDTCFQSITHLASDTLTADDIELPIEGDTITVIGCSLGLIMKDSVGYVPPLVDIVQTECHKIFIRFSDSLRNTTGTSRCRITKRTWSVGDSCLYASPIKTLVQIIIQDTTAFSPLASPELGRVMNLQSMPIEEVHVEGRNQHLQWIYSTMTDRHGKFKDLQTQVISAIKLDKTEDDILNGISTLDVLKIQHHIAGIQRFASPLQEYAADVDKNGNINILDLIALRKIILGLNTDATYLPWVFVSQEVGTTQIEPGDILPSEYVIAGQSKSQFIGIRIGDVNHDAIVNSIISLESRNQTNKLLNVVQEIDQTSLVFDQPMQLYGFQMSLSDLTNIQNISLESSVMKGFQYSIVGEELRITWTSLTPLNIPPGMPIITIRGAHPKIKTGSLAGQWYNLNYEGHPIGLKYAGKWSLGNELKLTAYPNPVTHAVQLDWHSAQHGALKWRVLNQAGQSIDHGIGSAGILQHTIDAATWPAGVFILELHFADGTSLRKKLVKIE